MTKSDFLLNALDKGNKAGAYSIEEARAFHECLSQVSEELKKYETLVKQIQEAQEAQKSGIETAEKPDYVPPKEKKIRVTAK